MTSYLFTMADMESNADFARRRGSKDKQKRKSRAGMYAGIGAGVVGGAGAIGAGVRYGGADLAMRSARKKATGLGLAVSKAAGEQRRAEQLLSGSVKLKDPNAVRKALSNAKQDYGIAYDAASRNARVMTGGGARGKLREDWSRIRNTSLGKGTIGNRIDEVRGTFKGLGQAIRGGARKGSMNQYGNYRKGVGRLAGSVSGAARGAYSTGLGRAGILGAGAVGAAGAGYAGYRALKNRKKKK